MVCVSECPSRFPFGGMLSKTICCLLLLSIFHSCDAYLYESALPYISHALPTANSRSSGRQSPMIPRQTGSQHYQRQFNEPSTRLRMRGGNFSHESHSGKSILARMSTTVSKHFFLMGMFLAVGFAKAVPTLGNNGGVLKPELFIGKFGVTLVFLLSGLSLELREIRNALTNWKLNGFVNAIIFGAWPFCIGLPLSLILSSELKDGILILSCLPTTVNMCVILTSAAGGNIASSLCNAVISNMLGIFLTPALIFRFFGGSALSLPFGEMVIKLSTKVLLPVAIGQVLRATPLVEFSKSKILKRIQELILLSILWNAFCTAFCTEVGGISFRQGISLALLLPTVHLVSIGLLFAIASRMGFCRKDVVSAIFCGSQKTLAFGLPLIHTIFAGTGANMAAYTAPIMFIHPLQLMIGSLVVPRLRSFVNAEIVR